MVPQARRLAAVVMYVQLARIDYKTVAQLRRILLTLPDKAVVTWDDDGAYVVDAVS